MDNIKSLNNQKVYTLDFGFLKTTNETSEGPQSLVYRVDQTRFHHHQMAPNMAKTDSQVQETPSWLYLTVVHKRK